MVHRTTLTLTDTELAESFRTYRDENGLSTNGAIQRLLDSHDEAGS